MTQEQFNLNWHSYSDHLKHLMRNLIESNDLADVTLVCDDKTKIKAHKFVLSSCSQIFQSIFHELPKREDSAIYLKGVYAQEMNAILQFMYLGQATFYQERMTEFFRVAKSLEIKEISEGVDMKAETESPRSQDYGELSQSNEEYSYKKECDENVSNLVGNILQVDTDVKRENGQFHCRTCGKQFNGQSTLYYHVKFEHEGIKHCCKRCNKTFTRKDILLNHMKTVHEGVRFPCNLCDYKATQLGHLNTHKMKIHK